MSTGSSTFEAAWAALEPAFRVGLEQAYAALLAGGLAVGAAITDEGGQILATGRNHACDPPGGPDVLQRTPLAHAEMNALAAIPTGRALDGCTLWTTQEACLMCAATAAFTGVGGVRYLAPDPWAEAHPDDPLAARQRSPAITGPGPSRWIVVANLLFLYSVARLRGTDHPTIQGNRRIEPETTALVLDLAAERPDPLETQPPLVTFLGAHWAAVEAATEERDRRLGREG